MHHPPRASLLKVYDLLVMVGTFAAITLAFQPHRSLSLDEFLTMRLQVKNVIIFFMLVCFWHATLSLFNLYASRRWAARPRQESFDVLKAVTIGTLVMIPFVLTFDIRIITLTFLAIFWAVVAAILIVSRLALRFVQRPNRASGRYLKRVLIVGTNQRAMQIASRLRSEKELGYRFIGFVDDCWHCRPDHEQRDKPLLTDLNGLQTYLRDGAVDEVIICVPLKSFYDEASRVIAQCEEQGVVVRFASTIFTSTSSVLRSSEADDQQLIAINPARVRRGDVIIKRVMDVAIASSLLVALSPLFLLVAFGIKATSPGPILFVQTRIGLNKRRFDLYKFRTMVDDAETRLVDLAGLNEVSGPVFKIAMDPRVTPIGCAKPASMSCRSLSTCLKVV